MLEEWLKFFIAALGEASKNISINFIGHGANFIQTNLSGMQLFGDYRDIFILNLGETFALKNLQKVLDGIDDVARNEQNLIQH